MERRYLTSIRSRIRIVSAALCVLLVLVYVAAKVDFFRQYFRLGTVEYLKEHSAYWAAMAVIVFLIWLAENLVGKRRQG